VLKLPRPHGERDARHAIDLERMRAQLLVRAEVRAFRQQPGIHLAQDGREAIRIFHLLPVRAPVDPQAVGEWILAPRDDGRKYRAAVDRLERGQPAPGPGFDHVDRGCAGQEGAHDQCAIVPVHTEDRERVVMVALHQPGDACLINCHTRFKPETLYFP
jgi:hypothetical protein